MTIGQSLKVEWSKWKKNTVFNVLIMSYLVFSPLLIFIAKMINDVPPLPSPKMVFRFPEVWAFLGYSANWLSFFCLGFLGVYIITAEFDWKTLRQGIIHGQKRSEFFMGKMGFVILIAVAMTLYYFVCGTAIGTYHTEGNELSDLVYTDLSLLRYFFMVTGYLSFGLLIGFLIRRTGLSLFVYFAYIFFGEPLLRWVVHYRLFDGNSHYFYPMNVLEDLMPNPLYKMAENLKVTTGGTSDALYLLTTNQALIASVIYVLLFLYGAWLLFRRRDI